jgi:hypothetical protein
LGPNEASGSTRTLHLARRERERKREEKMLVCTYVVIVHGPFNIFDLFLILLRGLVGVDPPGNLFVPMG